MKSSVSVDAMNIKRIIALFVIVCLLITMFSCESKVENAPSCEELIAAYENGGYHTFHSENVEHPMTCSVKVWLDDEYDYAFFHFFGTAEDAKNYNAEREYNILLYLFSVIYGDPSWLYTETYGNVEYEYEDKETLKPFKNLIK